MALHWYVFLFIFRTLVNNSLYFVGTGIRMVWCQFIYKYQFLMTLQAFDLGLNCDSSKWKMHGHDLFSEEETQVRRQIWWACVVSDR